ncbi:MAG TPA: putative molybdenum carrier protein [Pirellulales bacterium]|nr:putative molybdenum carrier protein [Pirellulales bacterium]
MVPFLVFRSGGRTGVDRAPLDFAIHHGLNHGGWCPRGGWAEVFPIAPGSPEIYLRLTETPSDIPEQRLWQFYSGWSDR